MYAYANTTNRTLSVASNNAGNPRRDIVVAELDTSTADRDVTLGIVQGTPASNAGRPDAQSRPPPAISFR